MNVNYYGTAENKAAVGYAEALIVLSKGKNYSTMELLQMLGYIRGLGVIPSFTTLTVATGLYTPPDMICSVKVGKLLENPNTFAVFIYRRAAASASVAAILNKNGRNRIRTIRQMVRTLRHYAY